MTSVRAFALGLLVSAGLACDPCSAAMAFHTQRCNDGDQSSCEWRAQHIDELGNVLACNV
jgi:hypothetical protein